MRRLIIAAIVSTFCLSSIGCKNADFSVIITLIKIPFGSKVQFVSEKKLSAVAVSDAVTGSTETVNSLVDAEPTVAYDSTTPAQAVVKVTTDNGQTFSQSFPVVPTDSSSFAPAAAGTLTNAFVAQNPADVSSFIQSAASQANATVDIDVQTQTTFQGPTDGSSHAMISRQYTPSDGITQLGSATYVAICGGTTTGSLRTPRQICTNTSN